VIQYWDTSALVKLVVTEDGSIAARALLRESHYAASCRIAYVEACAAIARAGREGRLAPEALVPVKTAFRALWLDLVMIEVDQALLEHASMVAERHALRGYDATHLAAAATICAPGQPATFVTWDLRQAQAAAAQGLAVAPRP